MSPCRIVESYPRWRSHGSLHLSRECAPVSYQIPQVWWREYYRTVNIVLLGRGGDFSVDSGGQVTFGEGGTCRWLAGGPRDSALEGGERREELAIARVGEDAGGLVDRDPLDGVHFVARSRHPTRRVHHPVAHELEPSLAVGVRGAGQLEPEGAPEPGLLLHLAERAFLVGLAALELALGEGPVPALRTVNEQHLDAAVTSLPRDHAACRMHDGCRSHGHSMPSRLGILQVQNATEGRGRASLGSNRQ